MKYFGGNILNLEQSINNVINNDDNSEINNLTQSIDQQLTQQPTQQLVQQFTQQPTQQLTQQPIQYTLQPTVQPIPNNNIPKKMKYKPLQVNLLTQEELNSMKTKQPFIDNNNKFFKASTQQGLQKMSQNISTIQPTDSMVIEETMQPSTIYPIRMEQHNAAKIDDDTTLRPIELARNLSKQMYPKLNSPSYIGHQTSLLANSAFVLGTEESSIFPDSKEIPLNIELNVNPHDNSEIGSLSKKLDGTTVPPQQLPQPVFYNNNNKLQGVKNPYRYYSQFKKIMTKDSETVIGNLKNKLNNKNNNTNNDNLRNVKGNEPDLDYMNFNTFMKSKDKIIN